MEKILAIQSTFRVQIAVIAHIYPFNETFLTRSYLQVSEFITRLKD